MILPLIFLSIVGAVVAAKTGPCEVDGGQSSIIVDIEESKGDQVSQSTVPAELPILGAPDEITMNLIFPRGQTLFMLDEKKLKLVAPLDRDAENLSHIVFQLVCQVVATGKKKTIPIIVRVSDINDNGPVFQGTPYETTVPELTPVGTTIFQDIKATDADAGVNGLAEYFIVPWNTTTESHENTSLDMHRVSGVADGYGYFSINLPHQGQVTVNRTLDYERTQKYLVTIVTSDRARNPKERFSSTTTLTVNIQDEDDQDPSFIYKGCMLHDGACINPEYSSSVNSGVLAGILNISPEKIQAVDMDTLNSPIRYSITSGTPSTWADYFQIDSTTGAIRQVAPVDSSVSKKFNLVIKAEEVSEGKRFATAKLEILVKPVDANPPVIHASSTEGFVDENSPIGTKVVDKDGNPIKLHVTDADLGPNDPKPNYTFELTTNYFEIDKKNELIVNKANLDRDPPNPGQFMFQLVAREEKGIAASAPLSLSVQLRDINDNAPVFTKMPQLRVPAGDEPKEIYKVEATDADEGKNAHVKYSIYHVSNNGASKFTINPETGVLESTGSLNAGEHYSLTLQATDDGGLSSQSIFEVTVAPGPNTRPPVFSTREYNVQVSEGAAINSTLATVTAKDPENEHITYSIVSGNDLRQFAIGSSSGIITVIRKLDREDLTRYQLLIKAEDPGKLSSTATVNIKVTDINDNNPEFEEQSYKFSVEEGKEDALVGHVHANDNDEGANAVVTYSMPRDLPFKIDNMTGTITTSRKLDYETQKEYQFVVTATDGAVDKRLGTSSVTVSVIDVPDELPVFTLNLYKATVPENMANYPVAQIEATDPDTVQEITYIIKRGDTELFSIDRKQGTVRTLKALDREQTARHTILIGTEENNSNNPDGVTTLEVEVEDKNDNAPIFTEIQRPITIDDASSIGTAVTTMVARDGDSTAPNNMVRYQLVGRGKANKYFQVDTDTGVVRVRDDLTKDTDSEYSIDIRAYDLGEPQLSSVTTLTVYVSHSATVPPEVGLGFADILYTEHIPENAKNGTLIRNLVLLNKRAHSQNIPLKCHITNGNQAGYFYVVMTEERDCALYLNSSSLDYEAIKEYTLEIQLDSLQGLVNPEQSKAVINIHVTDENDNSPVFVFPEQSSLPGAKGKYFATVSKELPLETTVLQVKAKDRDSGEFGKVEYQKNSWSKVALEYFDLDSDTGNVKNIKTFENVPSKVLPFKLSILAKDNPKSRTSYNAARASVVINLLQDDNKLILEFKDITPDNILRHSRSLVKVMEEKCQLVATIEKFSPRHFIGENETLEMDSSGTDVWFYVIDPETGSILKRDSDKVVKQVLSPSARSNVTFYISGAVRATATDVRAPLQAPMLHRTKIATPLPTISTAIPTALVALACIVLVMGIAAIIYICVSWNKYKNYKQKSQRHYPTGTLGHTGTLPSTTTLAYDSVMTNRESPSPASLKEYETQVLNMAVPLDDVDGQSGDLQLDFSLNNNHAFNMDNVSYMNKANGDHSPTISESATTARASSVNTGRLMQGDSQTLGRPQRLQPEQTFKNNLSTLPRADNRNNAAGFLVGTLGRKVGAANNTKKSASSAIMAYDDIPGTGYQRSNDNDNVTFGKRNYSQFGFSYLNDRSPVETTTEL